MKTKTQEVLPYSAIGRQLYKKIQGVNSYGWSSRLVFLYQNIIR